jgi:hypothetical protein
MVEVIAQPIKPARVPLRYICIIYYSFEYHAFDYPKKKKFRTCYRLN